MNDKKEKPVLIFEFLQYIHSLTLKGNDILDRHAVAPVTKPDALCIDDRQNVFLHDIESGKISLIDQNRWAPAKDICVVDDCVYSITAAYGHLGVAIREGNRVLVFKYDELIK